MSFLPQDGKDHGVPGQRRLWMLDPDSKYMDLSIRRTPQRISFQTVGSVVGTQRIGSGIRIRDRRTQGAVWKKT
ncbi:hypothetical protein E2C01_096208 [Portunus trituberculatus]|uniref:Uncharacterized protein n=1 Tax=Portunus trituberculatus TaxID=210409 RepID=A0A5B7K7M8_PORTR|nr:hypothetical protein [Portunus trituberculatus]